MARRTIRRHNPMAKALQNPLFRQRIVKSKKGQGTYVRSPKHKKNEY